MGIREDHELTDMHDLLREHGMLPDVPDALLARTDTEALLSRILASDPSTTSLDTRLDATAQDAASRAGRAGGRGGRATMLSAVAAAVLVVVLVGTQTSRPATATAATLPSLDYALASPAETAAADLPDARSALLGLAATARGTAQPTPDGLVQHLVTQEWLLETTVDGTPGAALDTAVFPTVTEQWVAPDGSGQIDQRRTAAVNYDGTLDPEAGQSAGGSESSEPLLPGSRDASANERLPRGTEALAAALLETSPAECALDGWSGYCLGERVQGAFLTSVVPQDLAGAFWEVLAGEPTVRLLGDTTDRVGRDGTAFVVPVPTISGQPGGEDSALVLVVSPETGQLLSSENLTFRSDLLGIDEPTVTGFSAVTTSAYTRETGR